MYYSNFFISMYLEFGVPFLVWAVALVGRPTNKVSLEMSKMMPGWNTISLKVLYVFFFWGGGCLKVPHMSCDPQC